MTVEKAKVVVQCGNNTFIRLLEVQLPNRKRISANDFINGANLKTGEVLGWIWGWKLWFELNPAFKIESLV